MKNKKEETKGRKEGGGGREKSRKEGRKGRKVNSQQSVEVGVEESVVSTWKASTVTVMSPKRSRSCMMVVTKNNGRISLATCKEIEGK
jgi:hypothetical protein